MLIRWLLTVVGQPKIDAYLAGWRKTCRAGFLP